MDDAPAIARQMWTLFEPVHLVSYFTPEARAAFEEAGLRGFWRGYFAGRVAPVGPVGAAPVLAAFCSFAPVMVTRALPAVWDLISTDAALRARQTGAVAALSRLLGLAAGDGVPGHVGAAADLLAAAISGLDCTGRMLGASNASLPVPAEPLARLWHAATVLREHRGDGHVAALVAADLDGCESLVLRAGVDQASGGERSGAAAGWSREQLQPLRGWSDPEWENAVSRLAGRGWLSADGSATAAGLTWHSAIEDATDLAASRPWASLGSDRVAGLAGLLLPIAQACATALPFPNPVGVPAPAAAPGG